MPFASSRSKLALIIAVMVLLGFGAAVIYYRSLNQAEDPRVMTAKRLLAQYDRDLKAGKFLEVHTLLDSVEAIYAHTSGYEGSFEFGVVENNRASAFIMRALYDTLLHEGEKEQLLNFAKNHLTNGIGIYEHWLDSVKALDERDICDLLRPVYYDTACLLSGANPQDVLEKRVDDILFAKVETRRRLSVAYTNMGIVHRHLMMTDSSLVCYVKALELWEDNHQARSNLDVLLGKEPSKRNFIQKLFPPDRHKPD